MINDMMTHTRIPTTQATTTTITLEEILSLLACVSLVSLDDTDGLMVDLVAVEVVDTNKLFVLVDVTLEFDVIVNNVVDDNDTVVDVICLPVP